MANTLYDENFGGDNGNCHLAVGASYSDTFDGDPATLTEEMKKGPGLQRFRPSLGPGQHRTQNRHGPFEVRGKCRGI